MLTRKGRSKEVYPPIKNSGKLATTDEEKAEVPSIVFSLSFQWQPLFPQFSSGWAAAWELQEQRSSHRRKRSKRRSGL